jgi:transcriptional regulator with XRE-family HTH domain
MMQFLQQGYSQRRIADTLSVSRNTVSKVAKAAVENPISSDILNSIGEPELHQKLFPEESLIPVLAAPDFDYIHKELLKSGVTLKLLWEEYVDTCHSSDKPPYMYSQYCDAGTEMNPKIYFLPICMVEVIYELWY